MATFKISPEKITQSLRDAFVEENFGAAYRMFENALPGADVAHLVGILKGEERIAGTGDGWSFEKDEPDTESTYAETVAFRYGCLWKSPDGRLLRPAAVLKHFRNLEWTESMRRALNGNELVKDGKNIYAFEETDVKELPFWMKPHANPSDAVSEYMRRFTLPERNFEDFKRAILAEEWRDAVLRQAGYRTVTLEYEWNGKKSIDIPEAPFRLWCMGKDADLVEAYYPWKFVVPRDAKMSMDNQAHSDWIAGAGLDVENWYAKVHEKGSRYEAIDRAAWDEAYRFAIETKTRLGFIDEPHGGLVVPGGKI